MRFRTLAAAALGVAAVAAASTVAVANENAVAARRGYYQMVLFSFGPLSGMAKGDVAYDAAMAQKHADELKALAAFGSGRYFVPGTSNEDMPGKTRALPAIWAAGSDVGDKASAFSAAIDKLAAAASGGKDALTAAVGDLGAACGACHKAFRAKDF